MTRRRTGSLLLAGLAFVLVAPQAAAQGGGAAAPPAAQRQAETPLDRFGLINGTQLQIETGTDDDNATLAFRLPTGPSQESRFALVVSTPLHGGDDAMPASLDSLANGSRVTLRWGRFQIGRVRTGAPPEGLVAPARQACLDAQTNPNDPAHTGFGGACADTNRVMRHYGLRNYRRYLTQTLTSGATDFGIDATAGINDFKWVNPVTLAPQAERHTDWSVAGHFAHYFVQTMTAITLSASYQRAYEAAPEQQLCPPNPTNPAAQCITARGAAPARKEHFLLSAGLRHRVIGADGMLGNLAIAPVVTYDVLEDIWGVDVPVYMVADAEGGLSGGVRFGYRSDRDDEFSIGVFMGAAFNILQ